MTSGLRQGLTNYGDEGFSLFLRKAFIKGAGYTDEALDRKIVGIIDTGSGFNPCHGNMPSLIEAVKRGIMLQGALPIVFPTISIHEAFSHPTSMYLRNLMSMDTEEMLRAQPMDAVVLIGGCDKTVPAQLMGAISADIPAIQLVVGPMVTGSHRGVRVGACTDCRGYWAKYRADVIDLEEISAVGNELVPGVGTCGVMGTASTMACITEAMGLMPLGGASAPANGSARLRIAELSGKLAATKVMRPSSVLQKKNFENAITVLQALGGSTNAIVHLLAIAGRVPGLNLTLDDFDRIGKETPMLTDLKPSGTQYMEDFNKAGGVPTLLRYLRPRLHMDALTITGMTLGEALDRHPSSFSQTLIHPLNQPIFKSGALAVLRGNLAPNGCIIKQSSSAPHLLRHRGKAVVFSGSVDLQKRIDSEDLDVDENSVLVLQNIGPRGNPGMPEAGYIPIPKKLARRGVKDMLRISDGRMSGTAAGAIVLHVSPEASEGGLLAVVQDGDLIEVDVEKRTIELVVSRDELNKRSNVWKETVRPEVVKQRAGRGYRKLYETSVLQAHQGVDFDFLVAEKV
ncbi:dehydratase family protein 2 [Naematelia encephala]|uniref:dihydroxy-acid dehydratase n=1 Tax=Naematelia encephala TaxID=71784 RepID=A0A1Y2BD77_9TREE|nr:dehydratase family protein 2 [Naematelia encephala]